MPSCKGDVQSRAHLTWGPASCTCAAWHLPGTPGSHTEQVACELHAASVSGEAVCRTPPCVSKLRSLEAEPQLLEPPGGPPRAQARGNPCLLLAPGSWAAVTSQPVGFVLPVAEATVLCR